MIQQANMDNAYSQRRALIKGSLEEGEWGDVCSMLDEYFPTPNDDINGLLKEHGGQQVKFHWSEQNGWCYDDELTDTD